MTSKIDFQDLSIVLAVKNYNPGILSPDFLNGSGVVPGDWKLASDPILSQRATLIVFTNGVRIEGQPGTVSFLEKMEAKDSQALQVSDLARRYAAALPNLEYLGVGINPRWFVTFEEQADGVHKYITEIILSRNSWQNFGTAPVQAKINLVYTLERCQLRLGINEVQLKLTDRSIPAVLFAGNFHYSVNGESSKERLQCLNQALAHWQEDLAAYQDLIESQFLAGVEVESISIFPAASL